MPGWGRKRGHTTRGGRTVSANFHPYYPPQLAYRYRRPHRGGNQPSLPIFAQILQWQVGCNIGYTSLYFMKITPNRIRITWTQCCGENPKWYDNRWTVWWLKLVTTHIAISIVCFTSHSEGWSLLSVKIYIHRTSFEYIFTGPGKPLYSLCTVMLLCNHRLRYFAFYYEVKDCKMRKLGKLRYFAFYYEVKDSKMRKIGQT